MKKPRFTTTARLALALLVAGALLPTTAGAQGMAFHLDPAVLEVLNTHLTSDKDTFAFRDPTVKVESAKFQEYRDLSPGFRLKEFRLWGDAPNDDRYFEFRGHNVGRADARLDLAYGTWGGWGVDVDYNKIVHRFGNNALFLWNITGPGHFEIADPTQAALQGAIERQRALNPAGITYTFLRGLLTPYLESAASLDIGLRRDRTDVTFELGKMASLGWALQVQHENRNGLRPYGGSFGFGNAPEIVEPIDFDTTSAELRGEWNGHQAGAQFGLRYSKFKNDISTLFWDNPFRATDGTDASAYSSPGAGSINGAATGFADLAPDNRAGMVFVNGRAKLGGNWWANGRASYQRLRQDDLLLPYTLNTAIVGLDGSRKFDPTDPANLPVRKADEKVNITDLAANLGTRLGDKLSLTFRYRYYDYDNKTARVEFPGYVRFHAVWEAIERVTAPYAYKRQTAGAELGWSVTDSSNLLLGVERRSWDRTLAETTKTDEDAVRLSFDTHAIDNLTLRASLEHGNRSINGHYDNERGGGSTFPEPESTNLPGMRKFNQAERNYDLLTLQADYMIGERASLTGSYQGRRDDYDKSDFGIRRADLTAYGLEFGWAFNDQANLYVFANRDDLDTLLRSRQSGATPSTDPLANWNGDFEDKTDTFGIGLACTKCGKWSADVSGRYSKTNGNADLFSPPGGTPDLAFPVANFDDVRLWALDGRLDYQLAEHVAAGLSVLYEDYDINSFLTRGIIPYLPAAPLLDQVNGGYRGNVFGVHLRVDL